MAITVKVRKTLSLEDLAGVIGAAEAEKIAMMVAARKLRTRQLDIIPVNHRNIEATKTLVFSKTGPGQGTGGSAVPALRKYFMENPRARKNLLRWIEAWEGKNPDDGKICERCGQRKSDTEFSSYGRGFYRTCDSCRAEQPMDGVAIRHAKNAARKAAKTLEEVAV